jgi:hypothetical protein
MFDWPESVAAFTTAPDCLRLRQRDGGGGGHLGGQSRGSKPGFEHFALIGDFAAKPLPVAPAEISDNYPFSVLYCIVLGLPPAITLRASGVNLGLLNGTARC